MTEIKELVILAAPHPQLDNFTNYDVLFENNVIYTGGYLSDVPGFAYAAHDAVYFLKKFHEVNIINKLRALFTINAKTEWYDVAIQCDLHPDNVRFSTIGGTPIIPQSNESNTRSNDSDLYICSFRGHSLFDQRWSGGVECWSSVQFFSSNFWI